MSFYLLNNISIFRSNWPIHCNANVDIYLKTMTKRDKDMIIFLMQKSINSLNSESSVIRHQNIFTLLSVQPARDMIIILFHLSINIFRSSWPGKCKQNISVWKRRHPPHSHLRPVFTGHWYIFTLLPIWYDPWSVAIMIWSSSFNGTLKLFLFILS